MTRTRCTFLPFLQASYKRAQYRHGRNNPETIAPITQTSEGWTRRKIASQITERDRAGETQNDRDRSPPRDAASKRAVLLRPRPLSAARPPRSRT